MERDKRIEKVNAFRKLLDATLKSVTKDEELQNEIQSQFKAWVSDQLDILMGNETASSLSEDEVDFLKAFIKKAQAKASSVPAASSQTLALNKVEEAQGEIRTHKEEQLKPTRNRDERTVGDRLRSKRSMSLEELEDAGPEY